MELIHDDYSGTWYWIDPKFPDDALSPEFDEETYALQWRGRVAKENFIDWEATQKELDDLKQGRTVVLPKDRDHAEALVRIGMFYLDQQNGKNY
jgi:hypothetical protein